MKDTTAIETIAFLIKLEREYRLESMAILAALQNDDGILKEIAEEIIPEFNQGRIEWDKIKPRLIEKVENG